MKHRAMNFFGLILITSLGMSSCGSSTTDQAAAAAADTSANPVLFTNGVNDTNRGNKRGTVSLKGTVQNPSARKVYLYSTYGRTNTRIDSAAVTGGSFAFAPAERDWGFYAVGLADNNLCPVILSPDEGTVEINFRSQKMDASPQSVGSKENEAWFGYFPREVALQKQIKDARVAAHKSAVKAEFEKQIAQREAELADLQKQVIEQHPGTYFAKVLTWKQEPWKNDKAKYWDNIDFSDESIIRSTVLTERIQNFMRSFSRGEESGFIDCIAVVADRAKANDIVLEFALNQMLIGFYESGMENLSVYIIDNYVNGDACGDADLGNIIKSTAESISKLSIGNTPPNITGKDLNGRSIDLMKIAAGKKYTLVMFWSSWCEHCQGEAPEVKACYDQWKDKGFELIGYSVDTQDAAWKKAVTDRGFTFPNLCGYNLWESKAAKDYRITKTPGFFLIDQTGKIVLKPKGIREVQAYLKANLQG